MLPSFCLCRDTPQPLCSSAWAVVCAQLQLHLAFKICAVTCLVALHARQPHAPCSAQLAAAIPTRRIAQHRRQRHGRQLRQVIDSNINLIYLIWHRNCDEIGTPQALEWQQLQHQHGEQRHVLAVLVGGSSAVARQLCDFNRFNVLRTLHVTCHTDILTRSR
jgi:hypothetical protein